MAKALLINPVVRMEDKPKHIPYGIALLAAIADKEGHQVQVFDANAWRPSDTLLEEVIGADNWDLIGVGGISTTYAYVKKIVTLARDLRPRSKIVVGGGLLTSIPRDIMTLLPMVDIGVVGEAFVTFPEILGEIESKREQWSAIDGIIWRGPQGTIHLNRPRELITDLDTLPYPAWNMLPLDIYFKNSALLYSEEAFSARRRLDINGSFGCPFICRFCFHLGLAGDVHYQSPENDQADVIFTHDRTNRWHSPAYLVKMAKHLNQAYGVDFLLFYDENLLAINSAARNKWLPELCRLWIEEGLQPTCSRLNVSHHPDTCKDGVHWGGTSHASLANPALLSMMRKAGCAQLLYGYESFSKRILKNVGKGATPETNERSLKMTLDAGIRPIPNQMIGFPDEFFDSLVDCVEAWERMGIEVKPFFATAYPGTEWYYRYKDKILAQYNGNLEAYLLDLGDATKITANICENFNSVELLGLRELMVARDIKRIREYEREWKKVHGDPQFSDVRWPEASRKRHPG